MRRISASWSPASCRTKATAPARPRDSDEAFAAVVARRPNLVFLDIWLQGSRLDGLQLLDALKQDHPELPIVMISGHGNIETAVSAIKRGAYDFIEKPFKADRLLLVAERALENSRLKREVRELKQLAPNAATVVGRSPAANQLRQTIEKVGPTNSRVLIVGPSGSGKELAARTIHALSARASGPFVVINAAAITPEHMEVELFGVEAGNGTQSRKIGALEEAHGGSLFIDEIAEMPRETQNKILRVLVEQTFQRVGGSTKVTVDVRIISSTSRNIESEIAAGKFREDLYHRLSVVPIRVPGLAERREDVPELVEYFMSQISQITGLPKRDDRRRRAGRAAVARLAGQRAPAAQQRGAGDDPRRRRSRRGDHGGHAAAGRRLHDPVHAQRQRRRAPDEPARCARRAKCSSANTCWRRSTASAATFRAPPNSSAWSARRCTASSRRSESIEERRRTTDGHAADKTFAPFPLPVSVAPSCVD